MINKSSDKAKNEMKEYIENLDKFIYFDDNCLEKLLKTVNNKCVADLMKRFETRDGYVMIGYHDFEGRC